MDDSPILVIDDDVELCELLADYLGAEGFTVHVCHDGPAGLTRLEGARYGLVVLDVMLPGLNGFEVLRRIRARSATPVLMLTARGEDVDRIVGLEMGADDYLGKPFNPRELVARIRAIKRRADAQDGTLPGAREVLRVGDVVLDLARRLVTRADEELSLTSAELALLEVLLRAAGTVVTREDISEKVLGRKFSPLDRSVDVHVSNLRKKLTRRGEDRVKTVRGVGYQYVAG